MTKKRFHKGDWSNNICEVYDNEEYIGGVQLDCADEFISLLNSLNEENEQLKSDIEYFNTTYEIEERGLNIVPEMCTINSPTPSRRELLKENKRLEQECKELRYANKNKELLDEYRPYSIKRAKKPYATINGLRE